MRHPDGTGRLVDVLSAGTRGAEGIDPQILRVDHQLHLFRLGHDRHRCGRGVDAALSLGFRHPLDPMDTALVLKAVVDPRAVHGKDRFLHAAQLGLAEVQHLQLPAAALGIHRIHPHQTVGEQGGFLAARPAAQLHDF